MNIMNVCLALELLVIIITCSLGLYGVNDLEQLRPSCNEVKRTFSVFSRHPGPAGKISP